MKSVLHTLGTMAQYCPSLGAQMFVENFGSTLNFLIGGSNQGKLAPETQQVNRFVVYLFTCLFVYLFVCLFVYLFVCLLGCLFIYLLVYLFVCLFICLFVYLFVC